MATKFQKHKKQWENCKRCELHKRRRNVVLFRGKIPCDVLFIGEAPGTSENRLAKPFVGPAGKLLDNIIDEVNKDSFHRMAFANLLGCIPFDEDGIKAKEPEEKHLKKCKPRIKRFIEIADPQLIVCVGRYAEKRIPKMVECKTASITHPAAILRADPARKGLMVQRCIVTLEECFDELIPF